MVLVCRSTGRWVLTLFAPLLKLVYRGPNLTQMSQLLFPPNLGPEQRAQTVRHKKCKFNLHKLSGIFNGPSKLSDYKGSPTTSLSSYSPEMKLPSSFNQATFCVLSALVVTTLASITDVKNDLPLITTRVQTLNNGIANFPQSGGSLGAAMVWFVLLTGIVKLANGFYYRSSTTM